MFQQSLGELISLGAVLGWTISALAFESAGRRIGSLPVNIIRLALASVLLAIIGVARSMAPWSTGIVAGDVLWLLASGFVGFFLGDLLLFRSYLIIGSRLAMLVMSLSPPISALLDRLVFGTKLASGDALGMGLTMLGVILAVTSRSPVNHAPKLKRERQSGESVGAAPVSRWIGVLLAFGGAVGQSGGMILGKLGLADYDPLSATFIRTIGGMAGFIPLVIISGALGRTWAGMRNRKALVHLSIGTVAGPVLGVSAVLLAMRYSPAGVVSAITAIVPIVIILPSVIFLKERVYPREVWGAIVAVAGVAVLFLT